MALSRGIIVAAMVAATASAAWVEPKLVLGPTSWHSCVLTAPGEVKCWGANYVGQLGIGSADSGVGAVSGFDGNDLQSVDLGNSASAIAVACGQLHTCAVLDTGKVKCWGGNHKGQLGYGDTQSRGDNAEQMGSNLPNVDLGSSSPAVNVWAGQLHTCVLLEDHDVRCWGASDKGQLGLEGNVAIGDNEDEMGTNLISPDLGATESGAHVTDMALGEQHSCALFDSGIMKCWGSNMKGALGYGDTTDRGASADTMGAKLPAIDLGQIEGRGLAAVKISAGGETTCALLEDHDVQCWGKNNYGQAGKGDTETYGDEDGEMGDSMKSTQFLSGSAKPTDVKSGKEFSCVIFDDNTVKCWGNNEYGNLGQGNLEPRGWDIDGMDPWPKVDLGSGAQVLQVGCAESHACVLLNDGQVKCWGQNNAAEGRLGLGIQLDAWGYTPKQMAKLPTVMTMVLTSTFTTTTLTTFTTGTATQTTITATQTATNTDTVSTTTATTTTPKPTETATTTTVEQAGFISHTQPPGRSLAAPLVVVALAVWAR
mmetsp:Transcript_117765/g.333815  ORF Transcript_117765/g.333815 Transcript_117765/m.333815 type:complete len:538 (+) Transcript_117765:78-1691(+)|eukprot:CAMPEP_0179212104 /NCGR_PEP_ID=MMETSP0797-20121207/897_1 /TAXON_ID=47934 /ORGANISM="Dinophysis acuminata, Strain DAEP01" /LENGTH=537 /DNA_ID=CAMNT_0020917633 /DNA_START=75 /DNA_END=1688 /DNA_ORIENTATION=-